MGIFTSSNSHISINGVEISANDEEIIIRGYNSKPGKKDTVVETDKTIKGDVHGNIIIKGSNVTITIEGSVEGNITGAGKISIGGDVEGNITGATDVNVEGDIEGNIVGGNIRKPL